MNIAQMIYTGLDLIIFYMVCSIFFEKKIKNKISYMFILLLSALSFLVVLYVSSIFLKYVILSVLISIIMNTIFKDNILNVCLVVILVYALFFIIDYILFIFIEIYFNYDNFIIEPKNIFGAYILSRLISILFVSIMSIKKYKIILDNKYTYKFIFISFLTISGLISFIIPNKYNFISSKYVIPSIYIFNILFIYYIIKDFVKITNSLKMKSISEERAKNELKLWQQLKEKDITQRKIMHDYSNTLICIKGLLEIEDYLGLKNYVEDISVKYKLTHSFVKTGNNLLDVLINSKYEMATKNDTVMILKLDNLSNLDIKDDDIIVLLSNLLDNAMEYVINLDRKKREIFFSIHKGNKLEIIVRNPIENRPKIINNIIKTTKKDKDNHGLGLVNIKEIVEKYNGEHYIDVDKGYFTHYIEI